MKDRQYYTWYVESINNEGKRVLLYNDVEQKPLQLSNENGTF